MEYYLIWQLSLYLEWFYLVLIIGGIKMTQWLRFVNQGGFPAIQSVAETTSGTNTTFSFNSHPYRQTNKFYGGFFVKIPKVDVTETGNAVYFDTVGVGGSAVPVYLYSGGQATIANFSSSGPQVRLCFYDRDNDRVQIMC